MSWSPSPFRNGFDLVRCQSCPGNVRLKVPKKEGVMSDEKIEPRREMIPVAQVQRATSAIPPKTPNVSRITVVENVVWHKLGESPMSIETRYERISRDVKGRPTNLDPIVIGPEWTALDLSGWDRIALLIVANEEGRFSLRPTPEQLRDAMARIVEVGFADEIDGPKKRLWVYPTETERFHFPDPSQVRFRCASGSATIHVSVVPG